MRYISTRGAAPELAFDDVLLDGLARDGGLYLPAAWPVMGRDEIAGLAGLDYAAAAVRIMAPFIGGAIDRQALARIAGEAYAGFGHPAVAPLRQLGPNLWLLELFHGPTLAFKDFALQLVGRMFDHVLARRGQRLTIVGATSGDTGSAAIEACRDRDALDVFILYPHGRVSEVQRRQMTTVAAGNIHTIAVEGSFDDCQDLVKAMFNDHALRDRLSLSAVNSINWARVLGQIVYYAVAAVALGAPHRPVRFVVPTGNFGNVFAGYAAQRIGLPIEKLVIGSNRNDILTRTVLANDMTIAAVEPSLSPSMDIQVSSNFERMLFELHDRDGAAVASMIQAFRETGALKLAPERLAALRGLFAAARVDDDETLATIGRLRRDTGELLDPHTAVAVRAAELAAPADGVPTVVLATAHPAKFPDAVAKATGERPSLPPRMADLYQRPERVTVLPNDYGAVRSFVEAQARKVAA